MCQWFETSSIHKQEDFTSLKVFLEAIMIIFPIESHELRDVTTIDIAGAYIRTE